MTTTTIRALLPSDKRSLFRSGDIELDRFFQQYAGQNQFKLWIGTSYVAVDGTGRILGYATVTAGSIEIDRLPAKERKKLPSYPLPILRLARLAVDESLKGQGLGSELLKYVLELAVKTAGSLGCIGVVVDAYPSATSYYERFGFEAIELLEGESGMRPRTTAMFLSLATIKASMK
ncbi:MAG TPA: GNAT family N-acetyltransferase [Labilithrix sp.]|nr:GNAT family N-acetyltransferase [Labilithrix sp.]